MQNNFEVIVNNLKVRHTGVSSTIFSLVPKQQELSDNIYYFGADPQDAFVIKNKLSLWNLLYMSFRRSPKTLIFHVRRDHEMLMALLLKWFSRRHIKIVFTSAAQRRHGRFVTWMMNQMDKIIATSKKAAQCLDKESVTIYHGVNCQIFTPKKSQDKIFDVVICGRVRKEKGVDLFVQSILNVIDEFPKIKVAIVGEILPHDEEFATDLKKLIAAKNAQNNFTWMNYVPYEEMPALYQASKIAVACPYYEGFGLTLFEAAAAGCAVIGSDTGAFPLLIEDGVDGFLVPVGNVSELACAIKKLLQSSKLCKAFADKIHNKVNTCFSVEQEAHKLLTVYGKQSSSRGGNRPTW